MTFDRFSNIVVLDVDLTVFIVSKPKIHEVGEKMNRKLKKKKQLFVSKSNMKEKQNHILRALVKIKVQSVVS